MKRKLKNIDYEILIKQTGDPFADIGGYTIQYLLDKYYPDKDIDELIKIVTSIYVNDWDANLNTFFLNSKITQPSFKGNRKYTETINYFARLFNNEEPCTQGFCRISGRETLLYDAGRDIVMLAGSGKFANFHHNFESGLKLSKEMIIRMHFIPIGSILLSGKIAILNSSNPTLTQLFVRQNIDVNLSNISSGVKEGIAKSEFKNPENALFEFVDKVIADVNNETKLIREASLTLYHLTNFGAKPDVEVYKLPSLVFMFYIFCNKNYLKNDWRNFVNSYYYNSKFKNARYNIAKQEIEDIKKENITSIKIDEYKIWTNTIYKKLLNNRSITYEFRKWVQEGNQLHLDIIRVYQQNIRNMKKETIDKILEIANYIIEDKSEDNIMKSITKLNGIKKSYELRRFLLKLVNDNYADGNENPIISVKDYTDYLFSDSGNSSEIRDVLIIAIYQKMHELNMKIVIENE